MFPIVRKSGLVSQTCSDPDALTLRIFAASALELLCGNLLLKVGDYGALMSKLLCFSQLHRPDVLD